MDIFKQIKSEVLKIKEEKSIPIPITEQMLHEIVNQTDRVDNTSIIITNENIYLSGETEIKKKFIHKKVTFSITLQPSRIMDRQLYFKIVQFTPVNLNFINNKIFNRPPYLTYKDGEIAMDFNSWEIVRKIPFGNIKNYELTDGKIILYIGI